MHPTLNTTLIPSTAAEQQQSGSSSTKLWQGRHVAACDSILPCFPKDLVSLVGEYADVTGDLMRCACGNITKIPLDFQGVASAWACVQEDLDLRYCMFSDVDLKQIDHTFTNLKKLNVSNSIFSNEFFTDNVTAVGKHYLQTYFPKHPDLTITVRELSHADLTLHGHMTHWEASNLIFILHTTAANDAREEIINMLIKQDAAVGIAENNFENVSDQVD